MGRNAKGAGTATKGGGPRKAAAFSFPDNRAAAAFKCIAELITPNPPDWLAGYLVRWAPTISLNRAVEYRQPTRAEMVKILTEVKGAAALLQRALGEASVREFLDAGGIEPLDRFSKIQMVIGELQTRADRASKLPNLVNSKGKPKPGRGPSQPDGAISARTYCALFIAEIWKWFREEYPPPRSREAAKAIELYWKLVGGKRDGWGNDPLTAWRHHLAEAEKIAAPRDRDEIQRHLCESARQAELLKPIVSGKDGK